MSFKDSPILFQLIDVASIDPGRGRPRQQVDEASLKGLANSIQRQGLIHPLVVLPARDDGRYPLIVGERRWRAALMAGEKTVPALIRQCDPDELLEIQIFENLGLGLRAALEPRDMACAIQSIAERFASDEAAAQHFGRNATWLKQATAPAKLSAKVSALLDAGKIASTGAAVQLEKLAQKNEDRADTLIGQIDHLPEGQKLSKKAVDRVLSEEGGRRRKKDAATDGALVTPVVAVATADGGAGLAPWEDVPEAASVTRATRRRVSPGKFERVAQILGLADSDEEEVLVSLIDAFLALKGEGGSS